LYRGSECFIRYAGCESAKDETADWMLKSRARNSFSLVLDILTVEQMVLNTLLVDSITGGIKILRIESLRAPEAIARLET
jgi:hypothetical protein